MSVYDKTESRRKSCESDSVVSLTLSESVRPTERVRSGDPDHRPESKTRVSRGAVAGRGSGGTHRVGRHGTECRKGDECYR